MEREDFVWEAGDYEIVPKAKVEAVVREARRLRENNPYHDEQGRFSDGPGGGVTSAIEQVAASGSGATLSPATGRQPIQGFAVGGVKGATVMARGDFSRDAFKQWATANRATLAQPGMDIGVWVDGKDQVWLEPAQVVADRQEAVGLGNQRNQIAIYDLKPGGEGEIQLGGTGALPPG